MHTYPEYKDSSIEWLGIIPSHWKLVRMRFLCSIDTGSKDTIDKEVSGEYPFFVRSQVVERISTYSYSGEAVLTAGDGVGVAKVFHYINGKFDFHQRVYKFSNFTNVLGKFVYYYLKSNLGKEVLKYNAKSTVDSLRLPFLQNFRFVIGSIAEQQKIVSFLDTKITHIDNFIAKKQNLIAFLQEERTALINQAVTKGLNPNVPMKNSGIDWLGEIPEHWKVTSIKQACEINPSKNVKGIEDFTPLVFLPMERVFEDGSYDDSICKPFSELKNGYTSFKQGDVLLAKITPCFENGKGAYLSQLRTSTGFGSTEFHVLRSISDVSDGLFLYYLTHAHFFTSVAEAFMVGSAGQKRVQTTFIQSFRIALPPYYEQLKIAGYLKSKSAQIKNSIATISLEITLMNEYKTALINEAVTGKIDVRDHPINHATSLHSQ